MKKASVLFIILISLIFLNIIVYTSRYFHTAKAVSIDNVSDNGYVSYTVKTGDTLWQIACDFYPRRDPREIVYEIQKINNITPVIKLGQIIKIPILKGVIR